MSHCRHLQRGGPYDNAAAAKTKDEYGKRTTAQQKYWAESSSKDEAIATSEHHACMDSMLIWLLHPAEVSAMAVLTRLTRVRYFDTSWSCCSASGGGGGGGGGHQASL